MEGLRWEKGRDGWAVWRLGVAALQSVIALRVGAGGSISGCGGPAGEFGTSGDLDFWGSGPLEGWDF